MKPNEPAGQNTASENLTENALGQLFLNSVVKRFAEYKTLGDKTLAQLTDAELHFRPEPGSNSIAVIIRHMHGNMLSRWTNFLTEDGEKPWRQRDAEFEATELSKEALLTLWEEGWQVVLQALASLQPADLQGSITIRSEPLPVVDAIIRQVAHYSGHVGQIVYLGKQIKGEGWQSLSIPKGKSDAFNREMEQKNS